MWNLKAGSKIVQQRSREKSYDIHRKKLNSMGSKMRINSPFQPQFVYAKHKLKLSRRDRQIEIDKHNQILLNRLNSIKFADYTTNKLRPEAQNLKTLNAQTTNIINEQISHQNKRFCQKLMGTKSFYPTTNILDKTDHLQYISGNISINARRAMSAKSLNRPRSSYTTGFSTQRFRQKSPNENGSREKSSENFKYGSRIDRFQSNTEKRQFEKRPETAPMFSRSQKILVIPKSGKAQVENEVQVL